MDDAEDNRAALRLVINRPLPEWRHGKSVAGWPLTWTGCPVRPEDWDNLSEWERHGSDGKYWCGWRWDWVDGEWPE